MRKPIAFAIVSLWAFAAVAAPFDEATQALRGLPDDWPEVGLRFWVNDGTGQRLRVGDRLVFHFLADRDAHVALFFADSHGVVTAVVPTFGPGGNLLPAGQERTFPPPGAEYSLRVEPPLGRALVFAAAASRPFGVEFLLPFAAGAPTAMVPPAKTADLVGGFKRLATAAGGRGRVAVVETRIVGRDDAVALRASDVVAFFQTRSRALTRPKLDRPVNFEFNSFRLTDDGKRLLDVIGEALVDPGLGAESFVLMGHTDDVGADVYNLELSRKRGHAARAYLVEKFKIAPERLKVKPMGKRAPLIDGTDDAARAANRRVEFELLN